MVVDVPSIIAASLFLLPILLEKLHWRISMFRTILVLFLAFSSFVYATDWPRFRGADGNASSPTSDVPLEWNESKNMQWATELAGNGASSPVVFSDRVYLTSYTGYGIDPDNPGNKADLKQHVLCFDLANGRQLWEGTIAASASEQVASRRVVDHGYASGTSVCDEDAVYSYFGVTGLVAFDHDGNKLWQVTTGTNTAGFGSAASPILFKNLVIVNASIEADSLIAFDRKTGAEVWRLDGVEKSWTTPLVAQSSDGRDELVISYKENVRGLDPQTGAELWNCVGIQDYVVPCVVANEGIVYVLGGRKNQSLAIRLGGSGNVSESHKLWETNVGANVTSPVFHDGMLYWASDRGIANCIDATNGKTIYQTRMDTKERVSASTVLAGDRMYLTTRENGIFAVALGPEYQQLAHNIIAEDDSLYNATPAVAGNRLLIRTNRKLYCIGSN